MKLEKQQKQEVEIKQRMTVSELAEAMNKDIGECYDDMPNAHQGCIYLDKKRIKNSNIVKYYYNSK